MDEHYFAAGWGAPFVDAHGAVGGGDIAGAGVEGWWVGEGGELGGGQVGEEGCDGGRGGGERVGWGEGHFREIGRGQY